MSTTDVTREDYERLINAAKDVCSKTDKTIFFTKEGPYRSDDRNEMYNLCSAVINEAKKVCSVVDHDILIAKED